MTKLLQTYRVLALTVGVLLLLGTVSVFMTGAFESATMYHVSHDSFWWKVGHPLELVWILHGWIYIIYLVVAFILTRRARWSVPQFLVMLISGLIPVTIFFVEHWAVNKLRTQLADAA